MRSKTRNGANLDAELAQALRDVRAETVDSEITGQAAARVWTNLRRGLQDSASHTEPGANELIRSCADFQALIPSYLRASGASDGEEQELSSARRLLLEDHTRQCIPCRKALRAARSGEMLELPAGLEPTAWDRAWRRPWLRAVAATALLGLGAGMFAWMFLAKPETNLAEVRSVAGSLYRVSVGNGQPVGPGDWLDEGQEVRTAKGSGAILRLADGSLVEMNERSAVSVEKRRGNTRIRVNRGSIIVEAAQQRNGRLAVATVDCLVSVKGTIFSVSRGIKGSRVTVIEGEVEVEHGREHKLLYPGDQLATHVRLAAVPLAQEIEWSQNFDQYLVVLQEFAALRQELNQIVAQPGPRFSTRLLDLAPPGSFVYAAVPNLTEAVSQARRLLEEKVETSPELGKLWQQYVVVPGLEPQIDATVDRVLSVSEHLGDEIVLSLSGVSGLSQLDEQSPSPVVLAEITNAMAFSVALEEEIERLNDEAEGNFRLRLLVDPFGEAEGEGEELLVWTGEDVFVASTSMQAIRQVAGVLEHGSANPFVGSDFHAQLADSYAQGAQFLVGVDLGVFLNEVAEQEEGDEVIALEQSGLLDSKHILIERKQNGERVETAGVLTFEGPRRGIVSWLAPPAPMGSLEFVSADANIAAAFVFEDPARIVEELLVMLETAGENVADGLAEFEAEYGIDLRQDIAAPLGGEVAVALDGPALPQPSWKLVLEVYDAARLQQTLEWLVENLDQLAQEHGQPGVRLTEQEAGGRTYYTIQGLEDMAEVHYLFAGGYLVAAPSRALLDRALQYRESRYTLTSSANFQRLLPADGFINFSALVYQNVASLVDAGLQQISSASVNLTEEQQQALSELQALSGPSLYVAYGEEERVRVSSAKEGGLLDLPVGPIFPLIGLQESLGGAFSLSP